MSDYVSFVKQRKYTDCCEDEKYIIDIFSFAQPECHDDHESHKQLFLYITRAVRNNRSAFLQEEKVKLGMLRVHSEKFCWKKTQATDVLIAKLEVGDFQAVKTVERIKIDEMRLPEKITFILPPCNASTMKVVTRLLNNSLAGETLLETEQLKVQLSMFSHTETKPGVENDYITSMSAETRVAT